MADEEHVPVEEVARLLGMSRRQAHHYSNRIHTQIQNGCKLFHRADVETLAAERKAGRLPPPRLQAADLVPVGELLRYLQETQDNLNRATLESDDCKAR